MSNRSLAVHKVFHIFDSLGTVVSLRPRCCYPREWEWISVCSMHKWHREDIQCRMCQKGVWVRKSDLEAEQALFEADPDEWRRRANERGI